MHIREWHLVRARQKILQAAPGLLASPALSPEQRGRGADLQSGRPRMPSIIGAGRRRIAVYFDDHGPAHVHVLRDGGEAKTALGACGVKPRLLVSDIDTVIRI